MRLGPCTPVCMFPAETDATAANLGLSQNCGESVLTHTFITVVEALGVVQSREEHGSCSSYIRYGTLRAGACTELTESNLPRVRPSSLFFPPLGRHCPEWGSARRGFAGHSHFDGHQHGRVSLGPCRPVCLIPAESDATASFFRLSANCGQSVLRTLSSRIWMRF